MQTQDKQVSLYKFRRFNSDNIGKGKQGKREEGWYLKAKPMPQAIKDDMN